MNDPMFGMRIIKEMTEEELIEELLYWQRKELEKMNQKSLRANVVNVRLQTVKNRMLDEANLVECGLGYIDKDEYSHDETSSE